MPFSPGEVINNRYRIVKLLTSGGYGTVYRAWDLNLNHACALKENLAQTPDLVRQFEREANLLAQLNHPNLPRIYDHFLVPGRGQFLVMEFIEGDDLESLRMTNGGAIAEARVLPWIKQVSEALTYLHSQTPPVIHRDIKPANIRITPQGKAVLVDFGIAKQQLRGQLTGTGARAVTPGYSPPEQYAGGTDQRSDVYALGATLYTLLTGIVLPESLSRIISGAGSPPVIRAPEQVRPGISKPVSAAIMRAIHPDPAQRYASIADFQAAYQAAPGQRAAQVISVNRTGSTPVAGALQQNTQSTPLARSKTVQKPILFLSIFLFVVFCGTLVAAGVFLNNYFSGQPTQAAFGTAVVTLTPASTYITGAQDPNPTSATSTTAAPATPQAATQTAAPLPTPDPNNLNAVSVSNIASGVSGLRVELLYADGKPKKGTWIEVFEQTVDVSNNPLAGERAGGDSTDESGSVSFELPPATYAVKISDLNGYPWGSEYNYSVTNGQTTVVRVTLGRMVVGLRNASGEPMKGHWVGMYVQEQDMLGNPVRGDRVAGASTNDAGIAQFEITPGLYAITIDDLRGEAWGNELNNAVLPGQTNQLVVTTGSLVVGILDADGAPVEGVWAAAHFQRPDVSGNPVMGDRFASGSTDQTGSLRWNITAGTYAIEIDDLRGELWGSELNHVVTSGQQTTVLVELGRLVVGLKDSSGSPIKGRWVYVYLQRQDAAGNLTRDKGVYSGYTDEAGLLSIDLTPGHYVVVIDEMNSFVDVEIAPRRITVMDSASWEVR